eukprot:7507290-Pyramimonas_sp.AAC.1
MAREIGSDNTALRTVLTFAASLSAGRHASTFGYVPTRKGTLQMAAASCLSPKVHVALLAESIHKLPPVTYADSCTLVHCDNDVNPGLHYYEAE